METETLIAPEISDYELERGKPMPSLKHALVQSNLIATLRPALGPDFLVLSELTLALSTKNAVPDITILPRSAVDLTIEQIALTAVPPTVIEILSPTQTIGELLEKAKLYFANGVQSYWLVLPELQAVAVYSAPGKYKYFYNGQAVLDPVLGVELPVSPLFD